MFQVQKERAKVFVIDLPDRMVWKADSTFEASSADVSMNDKPFSASFVVQKVSSSPI